MNYLKHPFSMFFCFIFLFQLTGLHNSIADVSNIRLNTDATSELHNEEMVWVSPTDSDIVMAVWRDFRLGYRRVGVGYSFDGGWNWADDLFVEPTYPWQSDPGLTWHTSGAIYVVVLSLTCLQTRT